MKRCRRLLEWPEAGPGREQPHRVLGRKASATGDGLRARRGGPVGGHPPASHSRARRRFTFKLRPLLAVLLAVTCLCAIAGAQEPLPDPPATFSILGYDGATGEVGGAVQSAVFSVGNGVLWADADVGVVATQAIVDVSYGPKALALLRAGMKPEAIIRAILDSDPDPGYRGRPWPKAGRQFAVMDAAGNYAVHTGPEASKWAGHKTGKHCTAQGNILAGEGVVNAMVEAFEKTEGHLSMRLMAALDAGQAAGGDTRGQQSAAMLIVKKGAGVWLNNDTVLRLQVDHSPDEALKELRRIVEYWNSRRTPRR